MIPQSFIQQLVSACDIEDLISSYVNLKRAGRSVKGICPFHSEKTPSFTVYRDTESFYCFGCGAGGDAISFIMRAENLDYVEAVRFLANRMGVQVPEDGIDDDQSKLKQQVLRINRETARFFHACLKQPIGEKGYEYLKSRELSDATITAFGLGFAPDSWDALTNYLLKKGFTKDELISAAVAAKGKNGGCYDQFRNRVMFPIIDLRGNVIAFGGRVLDDSKPKYLNSSDTVVFKKSRNLFAMNFAKNEIKDKIILAEGYMDVIAINSAGFKNVIATLGTALTEEQARIMSKYAKQVVIAYDSDEAGQKATHRAINLLSDAGITARVLKMEGAKDPDEYIKKFGVKRFELLIEGATDVIEHELGALKAKLDLQTSEGKIEYLKKAVNIIADIKNPLEREVYASTIAADTGSMSDTILAQAKAVIRKKIIAKEKSDWRNIEQNQALSRDKINPLKRENLKGAVAEEYIVTFLYKHPDKLPYCLSKISTGSFVTEFNRRILESIISLQEQQLEISISLMAKEFSHEEIGAISGILARNENISNEVEILDEYIDVLLEYGQKPRKDEVATTDADKLEQYRQRLKSKK